MVLFTWPGQLQAWEELNKNLGQSKVGGRVSRPPAGQDLTPCSPFLLPHLRPEKNIPKELLAAARQKGP